MFPKALNQHRHNDLSRSTVTKERCQHLTRSGRQCRTQISPAHDTLCPRHAAALRDDSVDLSAFLSQNLSAQKSAADIHTQLWNLSHTLQQGRISPRRAAVLAYISSLLLRTLPALDTHKSSQDRHIVIDMPRPLLDPTPQPSPTDPSPYQPPSQSTPNAGSPAARYTNTQKLYGFRPTLSSPAITTPRSRSRNRDAQISSTRPNPSIPATAPPTQNPAGRSFTTANARSSAIPACPSVPSSNSRPISVTPCGTRRGGENFGSGFAGSGAQSLRASETSTNPARSVSEGCPVKLVIVNISSRSDGTSSKSTSEKTRAISSATFRRRRSACTKSTAERNRDCLKVFGHASGTWAFNWSTAWFSVISSNAAAPSANKIISSES